MSLPKGAQTLIWVGLFVGGMFILLVTLMVKDIDDATRPLYEQILDNTDTLLDKELRIKVIHGKLEAVTKERDELKAKLLMKGCKSDNAMDTTQGSILVDKNNPKITDIQITNDKTFVLPKDTIPRAYE